MPTRPSPSFLEAAIFPHSGASTATSPVEQLQRSFTNSSEPRVPHFRPYNDRLDSAFTRDRKGDGASHLSAGAFITPTPSMLP
ncbi:hypothetical protein BS17DRAFT_776966 [Gyrodon lividus]|nr:hypothetical protein BS17DRAFT_776966 [Gyrodon lividus]